MRRKHGEEKADYMHPLLEPILKETYGVIIYQEQVMQIAQALSPATRWARPICCAAPWARRSRRRWTTQRERFVVGRGRARRRARRRGGDLRPAWRSSRATASTSRTPRAYALITYQTAYLKANFPVEFLAASMTLDMSNTDKLNEFRLEARRLGIEVVPPDVNRSGVAFEVARRHGSSTRSPR